MDTLAGVLLLGLVSLLVGAGLFLFVLGLGLLRWAPFRALVRLLPILLLSASLVTAGALELCVYLIPDFAMMVSSAWGRRLVLLQPGGGSGSVNLVMGLAFLGAGILCGHLFYAGTQSAVREGRRRRKQARRRQVVRLFTVSASATSGSRTRASKAQAAKSTKTATEATPRRGTKPRRAPSAAPQPSAHGGWLLRLGFKR